MTTVNEPIKVLVKFIGNKILPIAFDWQNRRYKIDQVNLIHVAKKGNNKLYFFSVSDKANFYRLCFNTGDLSWELNEVYQN